MGWASGTEYFDYPLDLFLEYVPVDKREELVRKLYNFICQGDWDTQEDSDYFDKYIVEFMYEDGFIDENEYQWRKAGCPSNWDWTRTDFSD